MSTINNVVSSAVSTSANSSGHPISSGLWALAWRRLRADKVAMISLSVVSAFFVMIILSASGLIAADWNKEIGKSYAPPSFIGVDQDITPNSTPVTPPVYAPFNDYGIVDPLASEMAEINAELAKKRQLTPPPRLDTLPFGADQWGHDVILKTIKGAETSIMVGLIAAFFATLIGTALGGLAGYFGGLVDDGLNWFYNVFTSVPYLLLVLAVAAVLQKKGLGTLIFILAFTGWTGPFRLIRAEYMKHKNREYVWAADAIGASHWRKMVTHIFPNVSHVALVQLSLMVVGFIKAEVILSFLGFGVPVGTVSWGSMLSEVQKELILGKWWQLTAATVAMAALVTAFSLFTDALRDALDPKLK
jgi:peptide/nickel transport system permease protein